MTLTPPEVARRWKVRPESVRRLLETGRLRGFRVGASHWRVPLAAVEAYEAGSPSQPAKPVRRRHQREAPAGPF